MLHHNESEIETSISDDTQARDVRILAFISHSTVRFFCFSDSVTFNLNQNMALVNRSTDRTEIPGKQFFLDESGDFRIGSICWYRHP